ncbi:hypothetical protein PF005_g18623 [Phytophthora fragariae]|uniref:Uncharacterized protein n=1 Tax=Phytophthora fragariae TaxID=53985 RepID=A0A6A3X4D1_9STRA|nr:hypothetical protein PF003_g39755 [Phytophthora fragariae]KAE8905177.1 hypothetical protein PF003_g11121 [Phytophthora fragariae]KAE8930341.1 hypothetical protein PF009_g19566 [Phytophthora fragariae]KAE8986179.1 hypothetical protein PF011_g20099 [Phytophthora fragariae]KAE9092000.1 hypothetical protein PF007_g18686 [Phytophthora fragariae]
MMPIFCCCNLFPGFLQLALGDFLSLKTHFLSFAHSACSQRSPASLPMHRK